MAKLISTNPAKNYRSVGSIEISTLEQIQQCVAAAHKAKAEWKEIGIEKRLDYLQAIYNTLMERKDEIVSLIIQETGKCLKDTHGELERYGQDFKWFLENAKPSLRDEVTYEDAK